MFVEAVKTRLLHPPKDDLLEAISGSKIFLRERDVVAVTSKVVSIWQEDVFRKRAWKTKMN
ncbi:MAG: hypothetical protein Greene101415_1091 [Parcubacteria group bacterium Greene1014_15]|nr:MAG: hypothetical protein Greene101415_1091 [Parcubacteria group bacterium Greene1014_15]